MATFNQPRRDTRERSVFTHEGGQAIQPSPLFDLMFTAACTFIGQDTFYESADERQLRLIELVKQAVRHDPNGVADFVRVLRRDFKIRTASILVAAEYAIAVDPPRLVRQVVSSACWRADEPAEFLAYWLQRVGRRIPRGVKLGLADAALRLYTERNTMRWDSKDRAVRMGDVIELCHVKPHTPEQATLFRYLLDLRHRGKDAWEIDSEADDERRELTAPSHWHFSPGHLQRFLNRRVVMEVPNDERRQFMRTWGYQHFVDAGMSWEQLSSWLPGGMDAEAWQFAIPQMQVFALIRNLRNFDEVGLPEPWVDRVIAKITSEEDVRASRIFPYQVLTAYRAAESDNWQRALGRTLDYASGNVPRLDRSLILVDTSSSMRNHLSRDSIVQRVEVAALQAVSVAKASRDVDIAIFGYGSEAVPEAEWRAKSVLGAVGHISRLIGRVGHHTYGHTAIRYRFDARRHDRAIIFTDDQMHDSGIPINHVPQLVTFNVGGYSPKATWGRVGAQTNIQVAGFSDEIFNSVARLLEIERSGFEAH